ncbi:NAD(P)H-dependent oxidoreductase [Neisseriaceae bacterium TC5R-5]|nr:NAD(P)H-dependent oxidoreductase [Neisseriaceae bacterium TC5R-5]
MSKILIINAKKEFGYFAKGSLNQTLSDVGAEVLQQQNHTVKVTTIDDGYDVEAEVEKYLWADSIIYQMPGWWMGPPWLLKRYLDEVLTAGHGSLYHSDGRSHEDTSKLYGSGGLSQNKTYMLSVTWNAPLEAFNEPNQFFRGMGVDGIYVAFHKTHEFLGMQSLPTFMCSDVIKNPTIDSDIARYRQHLNTVFA